MQGGSPAASGERGLGGSALTPDSKVSFLVTALSRLDGKKLWEYEIAAEGSLAEVHDKHNLASASPVTDGQRVYAWFGTGQMVALDLAGKLVWSRHLGREYAPFDINWGHSSSPAIFNGTLILLCYHQPTAFLMGVDAASGKTRWRVERGKDINSYSTPIIVPSGSSAEVIVNSSEGISGHNALSGQCCGTSGTESLSDSDAAFPRRHHLHEPRLSKWTLYGLATWRKGRRHQEPHHLADRYRRTLCLFARSLQRLAVHGG